MWWTIFLMAALVFASRYVFLEPKLPFKLGDKGMAFLSYTSPAVLTAIWAPIVFIKDNQLNIEPSNPYLLAATVAIILSLTTKHVLLSTVVSMLFFFFIK